MGQRNQRRHLFVLHISTFSWATICIFILPHVLSFLCCPLHFLLLLFTSSSSSSPPLHFLPLYCLLLIFTSSSSSSSSSLRLPLHLLLLLFISSSSSPPPPHFLLLVTASSSSLLLHVVSLWCQMKTACNSVHRQRTWGKPMATPRGSVMPA